MFSRQTIKNSFKFKLKENKKNGQTYALYLTVLTQVLPAIFIFFLLF